jgi:uncharacterized protein (DUF736 family)
MSRSQIDCGELKTVCDEIAPDLKFKGTVRLIGRLAGRLQLRTIARKMSSDEAPDYEVFYQPAGEPEFYPIGAAWLKNSDRVTGGDFLSLTCTHPDWPADLSLAAYPGTDKAAYRLVWSRPRVAAQGQAQAAA